VVTQLVSKPFFERTDKEVADNRQQLPEYFCRWNRRVSVPQSDHGTRVAGPESVV